MYLLYDPCLDTFWHGHSYLCLQFSVIVYILVSVTFFFFFKSGNSYLILIRKLGTKKCMTVLESYLPVFKRPVFQTGRQAAK